MKRFKHILFEDEHKVAHDHFKRCTNIQVDIEEEVPLIIISSLIAEGHSDEKIKAILRPGTASPTETAPAAIQQAAHYAPPPPSVLPPAAMDKIVFLGDSIFRRMQNTASFKALFDEECVVNLAVSGSTIAGGLESLFRYVSSVDAFWGSSNLVILLGTNDFLKNGKFDYPNYDRLISTAGPLFQQVILIDIPPIPKKPLLAEKIRIANTWIASQACRGFQVIQSPRSVGRDLVHLNGRGMQALGLSVWESLFEKAYGRMPVGPYYLPQYYTQYPQYPTNWPTNWPQVPAVAAPPPPPPQQAQAQRSRLVAEEKGKKPRERSSSRRYK